MTATAMVFFIGQCCKWYHKTLGRSALGQHERRRMWQQQLGHYTGEDNSDRGGGAAEGGSRGVLLMGVTGQVVSCSCCYAHAVSRAPYV
jgi:hypothetical protein